MTSGLHVVCAGSRGPRVVLIHGSAADHTTWSIQLASPTLRDQLTMIAYDRRSTATSVEQHADDAAQLLADGGVVVGSSFGAVVALDVARRFAVARAAVLIEPPMAASDHAHDSRTSGEQRSGLAPDLSGFLAEYDRRVSELGGPAAAEWFLRTVLGDAAYQRMPHTFRDRAQAKWQAIRADSAALLAYRPRYRELAAVDVPVLLLGGDRSASYFRPTLEALAKALPKARLEVVANAGHMLHAEAPRRFGELLVEWALASTG